MYIPYIDFPYLDPQSPSVKNKILECGAITKQNLKNNMLINYLYWTTNVLFMWNLLFKWIQEESFLMTLRKIYVWYIHVHILFYFHRCIKIGKIYV
jgi:hypothetical protein